MQNDIKTLIKIKSEMAFFLMFLIFFVILIA
ncbi:MAG: hypothetical protein PWQ17_2273 [Anaerophaga sp.]|nr:hypothetical protein [Anaerophaga sp.]MDN5292680.1 hypothetical protein [Anaerophaga sp.]